LHCPCNGVSHALGESALNRFAAARTNLTVAPSAVSKPPLVFPLNASLWCTPQCPVELSSSGRCEPDQTGSCFMIEMRYPPPTEAVSYFIEKRQSMFRRYDEIAERCAKSIERLLSMEKLLQMMRRRSAQVRFTPRHNGHSIKCLCGYVFASSDNNHIHMAQTPKTKKRIDCVFLICPQCQSLNSISEKQAEFLRRLLPDFSA
jgi:hypothetical protein